MLRNFCLATLIALLPAQAAMAAPKKCVTEAEFRAGVTYFMPSLVEGVHKACAPALPATSYFSTRGKELVSSYADYKVAMSPDVTALMAKISGSDMPAEAQAPMAELISAMLVSEVGSKLKAKDCEPVDKVLALLEPLPPANVIGLLELVVVFFDRDSAGKPGKDGKPKAAILCSTAALAEK